MTSPKRIVFQLNPETEKAFEEMKELSGITNTNTLLNTALSMFLWCLTRTSEGKLIIALDKEGNSYQELDTPALRHAKLLGKIVSITRAGLGVEPEEE